MTPHHSVARPHISRTSRMGLLWLDIGLCWTFRNSHGIMIRKMEHFPGRRASERSELRSTPTIMV